MITKEEDDPIYVGIQNPIEVRRALLESSKSLIKVLQENENRRQRRIHKKQLHDNLDRTMREITRLLRLLKSSMPKIKVSTLPKKELPTPIVKKISPTAPIPAPVVHVSQAQHLERELADIETKLNKL